jgi:hypothetical protein
MLFGFILAAVQIASIVALPTAKDAALGLTEGKEVIEVDKRAPALVAVLKLCTDIGFGGFCDNISTNIPSGCVDITAISGLSFPNDSASSAQTLSSAGCTLWE